MHTWKAATVKDLPEIAKEIIPHIQHNVIQFHGEMGAGKTTFIKTLVQQLGSTDEVSSPSYSLVNEYQVPDGVIYHFDFYRISNASEAFDLGWEEYAYSGCLCLVEWPNKIANLIPEKNHILEIHNHHPMRKISFL